LQEGIKIDGINNVPEEFYKGKEVCITGKIELYKDKPQIVVTSKSQIVEQITDKVEDKEPK
jgi:DNA/RNA endonuclease YhcR with UshA esterase domain